MKLAISNIAWTAGEDERVYALMRKYGYTGLEIAPTRFFETDPYADLDAVRVWRQEFAGKEGFEIPSMQSIWYGRTERLFGDEEQRQTLLEYTKKAVDFAGVAQCAKLVFGSPKNRILPDSCSRVLRQKGVEFFKAAGDYAFSKNKVICMEANPLSYHTNYVNTTQDALALIGEVASDGFRLNLDTGTMIENRERIEETLSGKAHMIHHVHLSEPFLKPIAMDNSYRRRLHGDLAAFLRENGYQGYVSVEMGKTENAQDRLPLLDEVLAYGREMFG